jgi:hypothetical protein
LSFRAPVSAGFVRIVSNAYGKSWKEPPMEGLDELEEYLATAKILSSMGPVEPGAHPEKQRFLLAGGVQVMAKPAVDPNFEAAVRHEAAGWQIAKALGYTNLMATTVLREAPRLSTGDPVLSSIQIVWPDPPDGSLFCASPDVFPEEDRWQAAVFDAVVLHSDRKPSNNWLAVPAPGGERQPRLKLIDTGYAFAEGGPEPSSTFYDAHRGDNLPDHAMDGLQNLVENWPAPLNELLDEGERGRLQARVQTLVDSGVLDLTAR